MRGVKVANGALWAFNGLVGAGIVHFAVQFLVLARNDDLLREFDPDRATGVIKVHDPKLSGDAALKGLPNPLVPMIKEPGKTPNLFRATLRGVAPSADPKVGIAFLRSTTKSIDLTAFMGERILYSPPDGGERPFEDLAGWVLVEVERESATFSNGVQRQKLTLEQAPTPPVAAAGALAGARRNLAGQAYDPSAFGSRVIGASGDNSQVWGIDQNEMDWALQNQEAILSQDFSVAPYAGGGLKIEQVRPGSIVAARGIMAGDVLRDVNGVAVAAVADLKSLADNPAMKQGGTLRLTVERAGRPIVLTYRPIPPPR
jgi:hypothetical protein